LDSWLREVSLGSGTAAAISGLQVALATLGHQVTRLGPARAWPRNLTLQRLLFNVEVPKRVRLLNADLVVGFDIDGSFWGASRRRGLPYIVSIKGVVAEELLHEKGRTRCFLQLLSRLERRNARHADGVLTTSKYCRNAIAKHYGVPLSRMRVVPEGVDLSRWRRIAQERARLDAEPTILCVARQYPRKHIGDLLRALPAVRRVVPNVRAIIVGDGPDHGSLVRLSYQLGLQRVVTFTGALSDEGLDEAYRRAHVFCLPSVQEGFGIVFVEAMACGLPIVATNSAAVPEVVPNGRAGLLTPPGDVEGLADALSSLLKDSATRAEFGRAGQLHAEQFDWDRVAGVFLTEAQFLLEGAGPRGRVGRALSSLAPPCGSGADVVRKPRP
jgi:glycosyltransferase involved in cell wall biosynthesis